MKIRTALSWFYAVCLLVNVQNTFASTEADFEGKWLIELTFKNNNVIGELELHQQNGHWIGHVEGGPVKVNIENSSIALTIDSRNLEGFVFERSLVGKRQGDEITGTFSIIGAKEPSAKPASWVGKRITNLAEENPKVSSPKPIDLSGVWIPLSGRDFRKFSMDLTPKAQAWIDDYQPRTDQPNLRCVSVGIAALVTWLYPVEILQNDERLTMLYEIDSEVRRIYLNDRDPPEYYPNSPMGFSKGHWEGSDMLIETTMLQANVRDFRGEPISENARVVERYSLSEDGVYLTALITIYDPENYNKPPMRRRSWIRQPQADIYPYDCDPDSYFRQLYNQGRMKEYIQRSDKHL